MAYSIKNGGGVKKNTLAGPVKPLRMAAKNGLDGNIVLVKGAKAVRKIR